MKILNKIIVILITVLLTACGSSETKPLEHDIRDDAVDESNVIEILDVESFYTSLEDYQNGGREKALNAYNKFALDFFKSAISSDSNEIISPLSVYYALGMLSNGAGGNTRKLLETYLNMTVDDLNHFLKDVDTLRSPQDEWSEESFYRANAIWYDTKSKGLKQDFIDTINQYYGNSIFYEDFLNKNKIEKDVNKWVSDNTNGGIDKLITSDDIEDDSFFILLNALTTGGEWCFPFESTLTYLQDFQNQDKSFSCVDMMHQTLYGKWAVPNGKMIAKEMWNGSSLVILQPNIGTSMGDFIDGLDTNFYEGSYISQDWDNAKATGETSEWGAPCYIVDRYYTRLSAPKFTFEREYEIDKILKKAGLAELFDANKCDLSLMCDEPNAYLQKVKQKAMVEVNEEGAYAAAATFAMGGKGGGGDCVIFNDIYEDVILDRPFIFAFVWNGLVQFMGVVNNLESSHPNTVTIQNYGAGKLNVRPSASTKEEALWQIEKDTILHSYETVKNEGYTWYRIGENAWVADKNGEWIKVLD